MAEAKFIGGQPLRDIASREAAKKSYFVNKGLRFTSGNSTFVVGSKWPSTGNAVSDSKYGRFGRMASPPALCCESTDYIMSIGSYTSTSEDVVNTSPRFSIEPGEMFIIPDEWDYIAVDFRRVDNADITAADGDAIRAAVVVYDSVDTESYFTKNLIGNIPGVPYPVYLPPGTILTIATSDGSEFDGTIQLQTLDANHDQISYWTLTAGQTFRTLTTVANKGTAYYVRINAPSKVPLVLSYGHPGAGNSYSPYFPPNKALSDRNYVGTEQKKIKVCAWNVGNFAYGESGNGAGTPLMYDQFIDTFKNCDADIYLFSEWETYWNKAQGVTARSKIGAVKPYWSRYEDNTEGRYVAQAVASNFPVMYENRVYYADGEARSFVHVVHNICGRAVHFFSTHLPWSTKLLRDADIQILQDYITSIGAEYVVIGGDFNSGLSNEGSDKPTTAAEMYAMLANDKKIWTDAGYVTVQGTFWGPTDTNLYINTGKTAPSTVYPVRAYDNIVVTPNIAIVNAYTADTDASDHLPIMAEIVLLD